MRCEKMVQDTKASCAMQVTEAKETAGRFQQLQRDLDESQAQIQRWEVTVEQLGMEKEKLMLEVAAAACMHEAEVNRLTDEVRKLNADHKATESEQAKSVERLAAEHGEAMAALEAEIAAKDSEIAEVVMMLSNADDRREKEKEEEERRGKECMERIRALVLLVEACGADLGAICREVKEVKRDFSFLAEEWESVLGESGERMGQAVKERDLAQRVADETLEEIRTSAKRFAQLIQAKVASLCARASVCAPALARESVCFGKLWKQRCVSVCRLMLL
jgi:chromosome segregation ATPase